MSAAQLIKTVVGDYVELPDKSAAETDAELTTRRAVADWSSSTGTDGHVISARFSGLKRF